MRLLRDRGIRLIFPVLLSTVICAIAVAATSDGSTLGATGSAMQTDGAAQKGKQLLDEVQKAYRSLRSSGALKRGNDISPLVATYMPVGSGSDSAAAILLAAGCTKGTTVHGHPFFTMALDRVSGGVVSLTVDLGPPGTGASWPIREIAGTILVEYP
jgi:hypothetical protein